MATTQVALIGCAHIHTPDFVKRLRARNDIQVKYVLDHDPARAQHWADELESQRAADLGAVLQDGDLAAAVVCSETVRHEELVTPLAQAGKHLFVEKPLGIGAADAFRMAQVIDKAGVLFQTGYFQRGTAAHQFAKQQIERGAFGKITRLRHSNCHSGSLSDLFTPQWLWMTDMTQAGVGAFGDLGTHSLDIMMWLMGSIPAATSERSASRGNTVRQVTATIQVATGRYGACDEFGEGLLEFESGAVGSLAAGWVDVAHPVNLILSGTEGHLYVAEGDVYFKSSHVAGATGDHPWPDLPAKWPHAIELFLDALAGKTEAPLVTAQEAAERSAVMEALYSAASSHSWVVPRSFRQEADAG
jgi:predicted dehydrogenase